MFRAFGMFRPLTCTFTAPPSFSTARIDRFARGSET